MNFIDVAIGVIFENGAVLISQRHKSGSFADLWEFPGGKVEPGETAKACLAREIAEELGMTLVRTIPLPAIEHVYPSVAIRLWPFVCRAIGTPQPLASQQLRWVRPTELPIYPFPAANDEFIPQLIALLACQTDSIDFPATSP